MRRLQTTTRRSFVAGGVTALAAVATISSVKAAEFVLKCGSNEANDHPSTLRLGQMWSAVERESKGRIQIQLFPGGILGDPGAMLSQMRLGALAFVCTAPGNSSSVVPALDLSYLGFAFKDAEEALRVMDGPLGGFMRDEAAAKGMHACKTMWNSVMYQVSSSTHPIRTPEDLRGFKIRVAPSKIAVDLFKALGASPTPLGFGELHTALQTKLVDGTATAMVTLETSGLYDVQKYISVTNHAWNGLWLVANGDMWKGLPPDLQEIIERNNTKYALLQRIDTKALNGTVAGTLRRQGLIINPVNPEPFRAMLGPYFQTWANAFGPTAWGYLEKSLGHRLA